MTQKWAPFTFSWTDHLPVDLSFVFAAERPAGKHGFLQARGDRLMFEDGSEGRFWGVNFNSGANFPPHEYSEMVARRLAKFGINIMRTHQMDSDWATPNIFQMNRAEPKDITRSFDPESMDRLDYLFHCLKNEGVYIYLDMLTYRQFLPGDGVDAVENLPQAAKPYIYFDPRLIELQKEYNEHLWTHVNPYTGLAYKDDPAIVLTELVNECDLFTHKVTLEPYRSRLEARYRAWAKEQGISLASAPVDFSNPDPGMARFFVEVMQAYNEEMTAHLRSLGVKIPITGTNWTINLGVTASQQEMDFTDSHVYWNYPWADAPGTVTDKPMVASRVNDYASLSMMRLPNKPYFISEWDHAYPAVYRAESSLALAAVAAFQGWSGAAIHTYRYSTWEPEDRLAGGSSAINGIVYRNFFDCFNDPAKIGLFYHAGLLLRRGDVQPGKEMIALEADNRQPDWLLKRFGDLPSLEVLTEQHRVGMALPGQQSPADQHLAAHASALPQDAEEVLADTGQLYRSWKKRVGWVDTPRTKVAYGFLCEAGPLKLSGLELEVKTDYAVIAISSLTDDALEDSPSILLTAVGRSENSGAVYNEARTQMLDAGHHPMLIEVIEAKVRMKTNRPQLNVLVITEHGELARRIPAKIEDGYLSFEIGPQPEWIPSTMYYLIRI
jgi:hypothetical protein